MEALPDMEVTRGEGASRRWLVLTVLGGGLSPALLVQWAIGVPNSPYASLVLVIDAPYVASLLAATLVPVGIAAFGAVLAPSLRAALRLQLAVFTVGLVATAAVCLATPALGVAGLAFSAVTLVVAAALVAGSSWAVVSIRDRRLRPAAA